MFGARPLAAHHHAAWAAGVPGQGPQGGGPGGGMDRGRVWRQPKGRTPIHAPWAQNAKPAHSATPSSTVATVGTARPDA